MLRDEGLCPYTGHRIDNESNFLFHGRKTCVQKTAAKLQKTIKLQNSSIIIQHYRIRLSST